MVRKILKTQNKQAPFAKLCEKYTRDSNVTIIDIDETPSILTMQSEIENNNLISEAVIDVVEDPTVYDELYQIAWDNVNGTQCDMLCGVPDISWEGEVKAEKEMLDSLYNALRNALADYGMNGYTVNGLKELEAMAPYKDKFVDLRNTIIDKVIEDKQDSGCFR